MIFKSPIPLIFPSTEEHKVNDPMGTDSSIFKQRYAFLALALLGVMTYGGSLSVPKILGDDWGVLKQNIDGLVFCPEIGSLRPLDGCWRMLQYSFFGLDVKMYNVAALVASLAAAFVLYVLFQEFLPRQLVFNLAVTMLFAVYPTAFGGRNFVTFSGFWIVLILSLGSVFLMARFAQDGAWWFWFVSLVVLVSSWLFYELTVGIVFVGSIVWSVLLWAQSLSRRIAVASPAILAIAFSIWRWLAQLAVGDAFGHSVENVTFSPSILTRRLVEGYRINLQWGWTETVNQVFPWMREVSSRHHIVASMAFIAGLLAIALLLTAFLKARFVQPRISGHDVLEENSSLCQSFFVAVGGLGLIGAGFIPAVAVSEPGMYYEATRFNILPSIGASLFICASLSMVVSLLGNRGRAHTIVFGALALCIVLVGSLSQVFAQRDIGKAWETQERIWKQLFDLAPDLSAETTVIILLPDTYGYYSAPLISGPWGVSAALTMLYGRSDVSGLFVYGKLEDLQVAGDGYIHPYYKSIIPFDQALIVEYEREFGGLARLINYTGPGAEGKQTGRGLCAGCVLSNPPSGRTYRWLVGQPSPSDSIAPHSAKKTQLR